MHDKKDITCCAYHAMLIRSPSVCNSASVCPAISRGTGSSSAAGSGSGVVGRQDSIASNSSSGGGHHSGPQPAQQSRGFYPAPPSAANGPLPPQASASSAYPPAVAPQPSQGQQPAWRAPNRGVYPDVSSPTVDRGRTGEVTPGPGHAPSLQSGVSTRLSSEPAAVPGAEGRPTQQHAQHGDAAERQAQHAKHAAELMHSAPLYVPAPTRVSPGSSVPREDLWYTTASPNPASEGHVSYPTVGVSSSPAPSDGEGRSSGGGVRAVKATDDAAQEAAQPDEVGAVSLSLVCGRAYGLAACATCGKNCQCEIVC